MRTDLSTGGSSSRRRGAVGASWRLWVGLLALAPAVVGVATFMTYFSISVHLTKAIAFEPNLPAAIYLAMPQISTVSAAVALAVGLIALLGSAKALEAAGLGLAVAAVLFVGVMFVVAQAMILPAPPDPDAAVGAITAASVVFNLTPPAIGMIGPAGGTILFLVRVRGFGERRPAIGAVILGGLVSTYWLFNFLLFTLAGGWSA